MRCRRGAGFREDSEPLHEDRFIHPIPELGGHPAALFLQKVKAAQGLASALLLVAAQARFLGPLGLAFKPSALALFGHAALPIDRLTEHQGRGNGIRYGDKTAMEGDGPIQ